MSLHTLHFHWFSLWSVYQGLLGNRSKWSSLNSSISFFFFFSPCRPFFLQAKIRNQKSTNPLKCPQKIRRRKIQIFSTEESRTKRKPSFFVFVFFFFLSPLFLSFHFLSFFLFSPAPDTLSSGQVEPEKGVEKAPRGRFVSFSHSSPSPFSHSSSPRCEQGSSECHSGLHKNQYWPAPSWFLLSLHPFLTISQIFFWI